MPDGLTTGHSVDLFAPAHSPPAHADLTVHVTASPLAPCWQRPTDSRTPVRSPATLAGLTIYPTASQHVVFSARVGVATKPKSPLAFSQRAFCSGDVLLSHGLSPYYHRGCSVSLPCSEWERVVPLRYCHQSAEPHWRLAAVAATQARSRLSGDRRLTQTPYNLFSKEHDFQSAIRNRKSAISSDSLISTYRVWEHAL